MVVLLVDRLDGQVAFVGVANLGYFVLFEAERAPQLATVRYGQHIKLLDW